MATQTQIDARKAALDAARTQFNSAAAIWNAMAAALNAALPALQGDGGLNPQPLVTALNGVVASAVATIPVLTAAMTAADLMIPDSVTPIPVTQPPVTQPPVTQPPVTQPPATGPLSNLAANTARNLGPYANPDPQFNAGQLSAINITDYSGMCIDAANARILQFGGGHGPGQETDIRSFDLARLTWASLYPSTPVSAMVPANLDVDKGRWVVPDQPVARHSYNLTLVRKGVFHMLQPRGMPDSEHLTALAGDTVSPDQNTWGGRTCAYDFATKAWTFGQYGSNLVNPPNAPWYFASAACLDPVSQLILVVGMGPWSGAGGLWVYDPDADSVTHLLDCDVGGSPDLVHFLPNDKFYALQSDGRVWEIGFNGIAKDTTITALAVTGTAPSGANGIICGFAYDDRNAVIGGNVTNGVFYAFDPITRIWKGSLIAVEAGSAGVPSMVFHNLEFDPVSGCYVFLNTPSWNDTVNVPSTWAFHYDKTTAIDAPAPILPVGTTLQSLLDKGGAVTLGPGTQSLGGQINVAGTTVTGNGSVITGGAEVDGKGILVVNQPATITGLTLTGAKVNDGNGAGIRQSAASGLLTVSKCVLTNCQDGYLGNGDVAFDDCDLIGNGAGDGQTHAIYVSDGAKLATVNNCRFRGTKIGHHFKSRSVKSVVTGCTMDAATESYSANFPWGGVVEISNTNMTQGPNTDNLKMISFGEEGQPFPTNSLTMSNGTLTSSGVPGSIGIFIPPALAAMPVTLTNIHFVGLVTPVQGGTVTYVGCTKDGAAFNG